LDPEMQLPDALRQQLSAGAGGGHCGVIAGLRPENFEDAAVVPDSSRGLE
jgi:hypothetical protein